MTNENIKQQIHLLRQRIFAICKRNGIDEDARHDIILAFTNSRTQSLAGLELHEMRELVNRLSALSLDTCVDGAGKGVPQVKSGSKIATCASDADNARVANSCQQSIEIPDYKYGLFDITNKQHRTILSLVQSLGHNVWNSRYGRYVADLAWLGAWIKKYAKYKKPLLEQTKKELQVTIEQLGRVVDTHY